MYKCILLNVYLRMWKPHADTHRSQKRALDTLEQELQVPVTWVLELKPESSARRASALNLCADETAASVYRRHSVLRQRSLVYLKILHPIYVPTKISYRV